MQSPANANEEVPVLIAGGQRLGERRHPSGVIDDNDRDDSHRSQGLDRVASRCGRRPRLAHRRLSPKTRRWISRR